MNEIISELAITHYIRHHQTAVYSPWANETVEFLMISNLSSSRSLLAELKLASSALVRVVPVNATALNSGNLEQLGRRPNGIARTSLEVMTGIQPDKPILQVMPKGLSIDDPITIDLIRAAQIMNVER